MIQFSRSLARQLWGVLRRCYRKASSPAPPLVQFQAGADGLRARVSHVDVSLEYHLPGSFPAEQIGLPLAALAEFEGRSSEETVTLEPGGDGKVVARWQDGGVPQIAEYPAGALDKQPEFPCLPETFASNSPGLRRAMDEAGQCAATDASRFAIDRIALRGRSGEVVGTDGKQLLLQGGFAFPWDEDALIPRLPIWCCRELGQDEPVEIGKTDIHVIVHIGAWTFFLPLDGNAKFPDVQQVIPTLARATTHWRIAPEDAVFLARAIPRLPGKEDDSRPLTVDLNGEVCLRARAADQNRATEVVLRRSNFTGTPVRFCLNREFLARAIQLGFGEVHVISADTPFVCKDEQRTFVAMPLPKEAALAPAADALRIVAEEGEQPRKTSTRERTKTAMTQPVNNGTSNGNGAAQPKAEAEPPENGHVGIGTLIAEAQAVKEAVHGVYTQVSRLCSALKRHRKQSKLVATTLASLRQLQQIDG